MSTAESQATQPDQAWQSPKDQMIAILQGLPADSSVEELLTELSMVKMIKEGVEDYKAGRVISHEEVGERIKKWQS